jgi:hypothetical protein
VATKETTRSRGLASPGVAVFSLELASGLEPSSVPIIPTNHKNPNMAVVERPRLTIHFDAINAWLCNPDGSLTQQHRFPISHATSMQRLRADGFRRRAFPWRRAVYELLHRGFLHAGSHRLLFRSRSWN